MKKQKPALEEEFDLISLYLKSGEDKNIFVSENLFPSIYKKTTKEPEQLKDTTRLLEELLREYKKYSPPKTIESIYENFFKNITNVFEEKTKPITEMLNSFKSESHQEHKLLYTMTGNISKQLDQLKEENRELRKLLDDKYSAKELFILSVIISIALGLSIVGWFTLDIKLIHPILSIPILIGSIGFSVLSYWKMK
ncbi:MAG: hypothetical protein MUO72_18635 [Bacteroidales bacterium]|nr:hypothetical protein [Bacteroidales bacterium]